MRAAPGIAVTVKTRSEASAGSNTSTLRSVASASGLAKNSHPGDLAGLALRHDARLLHVIGDAALEMDRLPDARERPIPALLAERDLGEGRIGEFGRVVGRAVDPDLDLVLAWPQMLRHVEGERQEPALVRSDERAVHPDPGIVEHRPEAQPDVIA